MKEYQYVIALISAAVFVLWNVFTVLRTGYERVIEQLTIGECKI